MTRLADAIRAFKAGAERLKGELQSLRRKGTQYIGSEEDDNQPPFLGGRACTRCRGELGRIINRGANCSSCNQRVCKSCRHYDTNRWLCLVCYKQMERLSESAVGNNNNNIKLSNDRLTDKSDSANSNIQRSCSFSDVDPPAWSFLRCSPDMRAYSSMPRHRLLDYPPVRIVNEEISEPDVLFEPICRSYQRTATTENTKTTIENTLDVQKCESPDESSPGFGVTPITSPEQSPVIDKRIFGSHASTSAFIRTLNLSFRKREAGHTWYIPPGVTPPRSRRRLNTGDSHDDGEMGTFGDKGLSSDSDDYKLVFISSSDSSSREELGSDDASSTSSGAATGLLEECEWDYECFECWPPLRRETPTESGTVGTDRPQPTEVNSCLASVGQCVPIHVPIPVPFPFPVPVFFPVPFPAPFIKGDEMTTALPDSEIFPIDEALCNKAVSPVLVRDPEEDSVVLKVYKSLDCTDNAVSPTPEDILRLNEARLKDFTDIKDDNSVSSVSSDEDDENRVPSTRTYKLNQSEDDSSSEFNIAASPPKSLTSASSSDDSSEDEQNRPDGPKKPFTRTFVLHESSESENEENTSYELLENDGNEDDVELNATSDLCNDVTVVPSAGLDMSLSTKQNENLVNHKTAKDLLFTESEPIVTDIDVVRKEDNLTSGTHLSRNPEPLSLLQVDNESVETSVEEKLSSSDGIVSIITFSHDEVLQIISEFLSSERNPCRGSESRNLIGEKSEMNLKNSQAEADAALPETRSNTSDEFSGTESMEMPLEDSLECSGLGGEGAAARGVAGESGSSARYTSLVMITQEQGANPPPQRAASDGKVTVVTGGTNSSVVCLEEGLADDDSWVEDLDREDVVTTEESSEEEPYTDREEELRGYHRSAIDFTLHTIAEESCEESESERDNVKPTELEKYFFYGLSDNHGNDDFEEDAMSETSSIFSEGVESSVSAVEEQQNSLEPADLASSRLEKYFLSGFMGFRRDSDGSVGSDSEGRPSPEQRRKRLVRARGTGRQHSNSLDNLNEPSEQSGDNPTVETEGSSTETDSHDEQLTSFEKGDGQFDTVKRTKKKKRSVPSCQSDLLEVPESYGHNDGHSTDDGNKTPQPEPSPSDLLNSRNKQQSRDSGFVGSCDDLLKESRDSNSESPKSEEPSKNTSDEKPSNTGPPAAGLIRKDSFNNWSSDEETNLMMSKMRAFFKTMVASQPKDTTSNVKPKPKPPQLVYFENELTRLMKTVPGLRDEQVREIVEYLSSEDTWSDSYDSSDYTSSDLENGTKRSALQEEISASCRQIISNFETSCNDDLTLPDEPGKESFVYQRLVASLNKMEVPKKENVQNSPLLIEKVMQHIGTRLWALMHEVSGGEGSSPRAARYHKRLSSKISASTTEEEEDSVEDYSPLPRSKSHDPLLEENRQEASDNERFSWRGSFESALMASDSRTRLASGGESSVSASALALAAKRRSAGDLIFKSCSREQLDRVRSCGSIGGSAEDKIWSREQKRRRSSVPDSGGSAGDDDSEEEPGSRATLPRSLQSSCASATNSLPRLPIAPSSSTGTPIYKSHSVHQFNVKSARYRPPGYRNSPLAPPPRRDRNRRNTSASAGNGCDDASICSDPVARGAEEEVGDELLTHRASLGARSDSMASVYSGAGEGRHGRVAVKGEVQFGLQYNYKLSSLEIRVQSCRDLAAVDAKRNRSDPYVKVYLLPDKSKTGKRKTKVKKHTLNPVFDDILRFQVDMKELESRTLWLSVWHSDMFGRNDFLGEVLMPLENKVYDDPHPKYYTLQERSETLEELSTKGEMIVGLKYDPPDESNSSKKRPSKGTLYVLVKEAKNLPAVKSNGTSDPFCKCYLLPDKGRSTKQKAPVVKKSCNPAWNHTFTYNNVTLEELGERSLELTIWDHDRLASNEFLGGVRLNLGSGNNSGKPVDWMDASGNEVTLWQRMMERPKFWVESCLPLRPSLELRRSHDL